MAGLRDRTCTDAMTEYQYHQWYGLQRWRRMHKRQLQKEPLCCRCFRRGIITAANTCHTLSHIAAIRIYSGIQTISKVSASPATTARPSVAS
jgi:hypothetical protein